MALQWVTVPFSHHVPPRSLSLQTFQQQQSTLQGHKPVTTLAIEPTQRAGDHNSAIEDLHDEADVLRRAIERQERLQARLAATKAAASKFDARGDAATEIEDVKQDCDADTGPSSRCGTMCGLPLPLFDELAPSSHTQVRGLAPRKS